MKYLSIYQQMIENEFKKNGTQELFKKGDIKREEARIIEVSILNPSLENQQLYTIFHEKYHRLSNEEFNKGLQNVNLETASKRKYIATSVEKAGNDFCKLIDGDKRSAKEFSGYVNNLMERDHERKRIYFKAKYLLVYLQTLDELHSEKLETLLSKYIESFCVKLLHSIYYALCKEMNISFKKNTKDVMSQTKKALEITPEDNKNDELLDKDAQIEKLKFQIENYQNTLELVQSLFDELKESVDESAKDAQNIAISQFFTALNSNEFGNLLDNFLTVEKSFVQIRENHVAIPREVAPLVIIFKQLTKFIESYGIEPIDQVERVFEATSDQIADYNYIGNPFMEDTEKKQLVVTTPGWRYKNTIISLPTVSER